MRYDIHHEDLFSHIPIFIYILVLTLLFSSLLYNSYPSLSLSVSLSLSLSLSFLSVSLCVSSNFVSPDVLLAIPRPLKSPVILLNPNNTESDNIESHFSTTDLQTKELERIFLRYNQQLKFLFRKYTEFATNRRCIDRNDNLDISITDSYTENWPQVEKLIFNARGIQVFLFFIFPFFHLLFYIN